MITNSDIFKAMRLFLLNFFDVEVIQTQQNSVPRPEGDFIAMTMLYRERLSTNLHEYDGSKKTTMPTRVAMQIDFYGSQADQQAQLFTTLFFDDVAYQLFPDNIKPLYTDSARLVPFTTDDKNYLQRWIVEAHLQINPTVETEMDFFDTVLITNNAV